MSESETLATSAGALTITRAVETDADEILGVLNEAAQWLTDRGIQQWTPGMFNRLLLLGAIDDGEVYIVRRDGASVATISLGWSDALTWGTMPDDAGYVHDLAIRRIVGGQRVGRALLDWAARTSAAAGKDFVRLDCNADNEPLNDYYRRAGFSFRGSVLSPYTGRQVSLYERRARLAEDTAAGELAIRPARPEEVETVAAILEEVADWLTARGIDQWRMGDWLRPHIAEGIARGEVYLAELGGNMVGTVRLQWSDDRTWGAMPDDAGYVHSLAVRRAYGGRGIGRELLAWAERTAAAAGKAYLRLDCVAWNEALNAYYREAGFAYVRTVGEGNPGNLYQKRVG